MNSASGMLKCVHACVRACVCACVCMCARANQTTLLNAQYTSHLLEVIQSGKR